MSQPAHLSPFIALHGIFDMPLGAPNRDGNGQAKRGYLGTAEVSRISSQAQKFYKRQSDLMAELAESSGFGMTVRSREIAQQKIKPMLITMGLNEAEAADYANAVVKFTTVPAKKAKSGDDKAAKGKGRGKGKAGPDEEGADADEAAEQPKQIDVASQPLVFGEQEVRAMITLAKAAHTAGVSAQDLAGHKTGKLIEAETKALKAVGSKAGIDAMMHGRFTTGDFLSNIDGAISRSHIMGTHPITSVIDYFTAYDELAENPGASHLNSQELFNGVHYGNSVISVRQLLKNLGGNSELAAKAIEFEIEDFMYNNTRAKMGGTGAGSRAFEVVAEVFFRHSPVTYHGIYVNKHCYRSAEAAELLVQTSAEEAASRSGVIVAATLSGCRTEKVNFAEKVLAAAGFSAKAAAKAA